MKKQVLFIIMMLMPLMASASTNINGIYYNLNSTNKVAEVTSVPSGTAKYSGSVVIPKTVAYGGETYSVTSIGVSAFSGCSGLTSIIIPNSVITIGNSAFRNCSGLTSIIIPNSVTSIENGTFYECSSLTSVIIPNSITSIDDYAFSGCSSLTSVTFGNNVTTIGGYAFRSCLNLTSVHISDLSAWCNINFFISPIPYSNNFDYSSNPLYFARHLYLNGEEVKDLVIPDGVTSISNCAFINCTSLTSISIPNSVTSIGSNAFWNCSELTSVYIADIAAWCKITFSNYASNPLCFAHNLFLNGEKVKDLVIPNSVTSIRNYTFRNCSGINSVTIPNSVASIGEHAFYYCSGLTSIIIGRSIETIGSYAFAGCERLEDVYCHAEKVPSAETNAFDNSYISYATLHVPENSINQYRRREPWSGFETITGILEEEYNDGDRCEKPVITLLANGKIKVESATEGATCVTNISASTANPLTDGEISLSTPLIVYTVTAYATAEGYDDSEVATATFRFEGNKGDVDGDGKIDISDLTQLVNIILGQ